MDTSGVQPPPSAGTRPTLYPLTQGQRQLYSALRRKPDLCVPIWASYRIRGPLDRDDLAWALARTVADHDALRIAVAAIDLPGYEPWQWTRPEPDDDTLIDFRELAHASEDFAFSMRTLLTDDVLRPPDLKKEYPFRFRLVRCSPDLHGLLASFSPMALDRRGRTTVLRDLWENLGRRLAGEVASAAPLSSRFVDTAVQHAELAAKESAKTTSFWEKRLTQGPRPAVDLVGQPQWSADCSARILTITGPELARFRAAAQTQGCSEFQLIVAAFASAIFGALGLDRISIATPVDGRRNRERDLAGMFVSTLPLILERARDHGELVRQARHETLSVTSHRHASHDVMRRLSRAYDSPSSGLASVFTIDYRTQDSPWHLSLDGPDGAITVDLGAYDPKFQHATKGISLLGASDQDRMTLTVLYLNRLMTRRTADDFIAHVRAGLDGALASEPG
jgi:hypothetical protein